MFTFLVSYVVYYICISTIKIIQFLSCILHIYIFICIFVLKYLKYFQYWEGGSVGSTCCTSLTTWVQIPRTHAKSTCICISPTRRRKQRQENTTHISEQERPVSEKVEDEARHLNLSSDLHTDAIIPVYSYPNKIKALPNHKKPKKTKAYGYSIKPRSLFPWAYLKANIKMLF